MGRATRVFVVTPIRLYSEGIAQYLAACEDVDVIGVAAEGAAPLIGAGGLRPDVVVLDMALSDSLDTARALRRTLPEIAIVALAVPETEEHVLRCAEAGICGYVPREGSLDELVGAVRRAARGDAVGAPAIIGGLFRRVAALAEEAAPNGDGPAPQRLTAREAEIIGLIDDGLSNKQIATRLCIEVATVKNHVHSILDKLGASSRGEAAARARRIGR